MARIGWWMRLFLRIDDFLSPPCDGQAERDALAESERRFRAEQQRIFERAEAYERAEAFRRAEAKARMCGYNHDGHEL